MWPAKILALFDAVDWSASDESELYGPFNALLDVCWPWEEGWNVVPHKQPIRGTSEFATNLMITRHRLPVSFLQIKPASHFDPVGTRASADSQMRNSVVLLQSVVQLPVFHAFSAFGSHLCHYKLNISTGELTPSNTESDVTDTAPATHWNFNVLSEEGSATFLDVVADVKRMCQKLDKT